MRALEYVACVRGSSLSCLQSSSSSWWLSSLVSQAVFSEQGPSLAQYVSVRRPAGLSYLLTLGNRLIPQMSKSRPRHKSRPVHLLQPRLISMRQREPATLPLKHRHPCGKSPPRRTTRPSS